MAARSTQAHLKTAQGPSPDQRYVAWSEIDPTVYTQSGAQLMTNGIRIPLPAPFSSDVVHIEPQQ